MANKKLKKLLYTKKDILIRKFLAPMFANFPDRSYWKGTELTRFGSATFSW
jgi:hypothetical protein